MCDGFFCVTVTNVCSLQDYRYMASAATLDSL